MACHALVGVLWDAGHLAGSGLAESHYMIEGSRSIEMDLGEGWRGLRLE